MNKTYLVLLLAAFSLELFCQQNNEMVLDSTISYRWDSDDNDWKLMNLWCLTAPCEGGRHLYYYDHGRNLTEEILFDLDIETNTWKDSDRRVRSYDSCGRLTENIWHHRDPVSNDWKAMPIHCLHGCWGGKYVYNYDESGNLSEEIWCTVDTISGEWAVGVHSNRKVYEYDTNTNLIVESRYNWDSETNVWDNWYRNVRSYDSCQNLSEEMVYDWAPQNKDWALNHRQVYSYDSSGNLIEKFTSRVDLETKDWLFVNRYVYSYDPNGNLTVSMANWYEQETKVWNNWYRHVRSYDSCENLTEKIEYDWDQETKNWQGVSRETWKYDSSGNLTEEIRYVWDSEIQSWGYGTKEIHYWSYLLIGQHRFYVNENCGDCIVLGSLITGKNYSREKIKINIKEEDPCNMLSVDTLTGDVFLINPGNLDHETTTQYHLILEAQYKDSTSVITNEADIWLYVYNVNDNMPVIIDTIFTTEENSHSGTVLGKVIAHDADGNLNPLTYSIIEGNLDSAFSIASNNGIIMVYNSVLDYETRPVYDLKVIVTDGTYSDTAVVTINLLNDTADDPSFINHRASHNDFKLYPNPANDILYLKISDKRSGEFNVELVSLTGKVVYQNTGYIEQINIANLPEGIYFVKVRLDMEMMIEKVVIQ